MQKLFIDEQGRVRSGWRAALFLIAYVILSGIMIAIWLAATGPFLALDSPLRLIVPFAFATALALVLGWFFGRYFERLPFAALGADFSGRWVRNFLIGLGVGGAAFVTALIVALAGRGLTFTVNTTSSGAAIASTLVTSLPVMAVAAASEEALFRGYPLQTFARSRIAWIGIVLTSLLFAFAHNNNPSANMLGLANTVLAGWWFAAAYFKTRDLWFPFGIHLAWNWLQGPFFGINVSGIETFSPDPVLRAIDSGPKWLTGGSYGIEGGVACTIALVISTGVIYLLPMKPNHIER